METTNDINEVNYNVNLSHGLESLEESSTGLLATRQQDIHSWVGCTTSYLLAILMGCQGYFKNCVVGKGCNLFNIFVQSMYPL